MYKIVQTDEEVHLENGEKAKPVLTLADEWGGRAQIINDDHCYVLLLKREPVFPLVGPIYIKTSWWFREAVQALKTLPDPE